MTVSRLKICLYYVAESKPFIIPDVQKRKKKCIFGSTASLFTYNKRSADYDYLVCWSS